MQAIQVPVDLQEGKFRITCLGCGSVVLFASKAGAVAALNRKSCRECRIDYRAKTLPDDAVYKNSDGKWCSKCPSCNAEQAYTRMDHAKTSHSSGWRCKSCAASEKAFASAATGFVGNIRVGWFKKFEKSAAFRNLRWQLSIEFLNSLWTKQAGRCALSGVELNNAYGTETVSIDRIDNDRGYEEDNVQLIHKALNLMKRDMPDDEFVAWCRLVAESKQ